MQKIKLILLKILVFLITFLLTYGVFELSFALSIKCLKFMMNSHTIISSIVAIIMGILIGYSVKKIN